MRLMAGVWMLLAVQIPALAQPLAIRNVRVVDVVNRSVSAPRTVFVAGDRIAASGGSAMGAIDGTGKFLIPGLWDMHGAVPIESPASGLRLGVTGVRDMSETPLGTLLALYRGIEAGTVAGPRILTGGPAVQAHGPTAARDAFDRLYETEADFVRFDKSLDPEAFIAMAERSRKWRYPLVGPLPQSIRLRDAAALRQSSIEGTEGLEGVACEGFFMAAREGVWFTPLARTASKGLVRWMYDCGARMLAGSAGGSLHDELEAMVEAGLSPMDAIRTATYEPSKFLNSDVGVIAPGKLADMVLLDADPTLDVRNLRRVAGVIVRGRYHPDVPTIRTSSPTPVIRSGTRPSAESSAKPQASSAKPASPIR